MKHKYPKSATLVMRYLDLNISASKNRTMFGDITVRPRKWFFSHSCLLEKESLGFSESNKTKQLQIVMRFCREMTEIRNQVYQYMSIFLPFLYVFQKFCPQFFNISCIVIYTFLSEKAWKPKTVWARWIQNSLYCIFLEHLHEKKSFPEP
jgi:hypothetical protein